VLKVSKAKRKKRNRVGAVWGENKVPRSGLRKDKQKKSSWDGTG
jgi:hypothetical protein